MILQEENIDSQSTRIPGKFLCTNRATYKVILIILFLFVFFIAGCRKTNDELEEILEADDPRAFDYSVRLTDIFWLKFLFCLIV